MACQYLIFALPLFMPRCFGQEGFETPKTECPPMCKPGEFVTSDNVCGKLAQLGESCDRTRVCEQGYAACIAGRCRCMSGFVQLDGHCYARKYNCPGAATTSSVQACVINADLCEGADEIQMAPNFGTRCLKESFPFSQTSRKKRHTKKTPQYQWNGSCPAGKYCYVAEGYVIKGCHAFAVGFCCDQSCPIGDAHPFAGCGSDARYPCENIPGYGCHRSYLTPGSLNAFGEHLDKFFPATCCPRHCPHDFVTVDVGHCYPPAKGLDYACWRDEQCYSRKCIQGQCQCEAPLKRLTYSSGGDACIDLQSTRELGDLCNPGETCGPAHSKCYNGKCVCTCGYTSVNGSCVKKGACPHDKSEGCSRWAEEGECQNNPNWMIANCPVSCGIC